MIITIFLFVLFSLSINGQVKIKTEILDVDFCDLKNNPDDFVGKLIRTKAIYTASLESSWLSADKSINCVLNVVFDKEWREKSPPKSIKKFEKGLRIKNGKIGERRSVKVKFIGVFSSTMLGKEPILPVYQIKIIYLE